MAKKSAPTKPAAETKSDEGFVEETRGAKEKPVSVEDVREKLKEAMALNQKLVRQLVDQGKPYSRFQIAGQKLNQMLTNQVVK